ncbi:uncharacterized protein LOC108158335 [Drosophila miranda]|uniref:uncharacterized protein LOC108158335 n=1 Tax=Drosophila miranda TaxID=7229 RepID=UPI00143F06EA|nr:uncharacterized protein LOC108158335 [Drosophila miranda]
MCPGRGLIQKLLYSQILTLVLEPLRPVLQLQRHCPIMPADLVAKERYQRDLNTHIKAIDEQWKEQLSWYPQMQDFLYGRVPQIYLESRQMYGDEHFLRYARRHRLHQKHTVTKQDAERILLEHQEKLDADALNCKASPTENGEYGRVKPTRQHFG